MQEIKLKIITNKTYIFLYVTEIKKDDQYLYVVNKGDKREHIFKIKDIKQIMMAK